MKGTAWKKIEPDRPCGACIEVEERAIWFWQFNRYIRDGWTVTADNRHGLLRLHAERCIG